MEQWLEGYTLTVLYMYACDILGVNELEVLIKESSDASKMGSEEVARRRTLGERSRTSASRI